MHLSFLIITIFLHQSNGFLFDGKPLFPSTSSITNSSKSPLIHVTGGKGGAEDIAGKDGKSNVQIQKIDDPHSMTMTHTNTNGDVFMLMSHNHSMINTLIHDSNETDHKMLMINNDKNKPASLFMLPKMMFATKSGNQSNVEITDGNGADASDGGKD
jgi:hypothetical protein